MLEVFSLAESTPFPEVSEALLQNCVDFLLAILATPSDYDKFVKEHSQESGALRLLARVDFGKMAFVDTRPCSILLQETVSCMRKIKRSIRPHHHLKKLIRNIREVKEGNEYNCANGFPRFYEADPGVPNYEEYREMILSLSDLHLVTVKSLKNSMKRDAEVAAEEGTPLTWKTKVKESDGSREFTHEQSVRLHLDLMTEIRKDEEYERGLWTWECISVIWGLIVSSTTVPEAQEFLVFV